jgi:sugar lactone lactonase YvrE
MTSDPRVSVFRAIPAKLGEGVLWHPVRQSLFWVDILGRTVFETRLDGDATRQLGLEQFVGALVPTADGGLVAALHRGIHRLDPETGATGLLATPADHDPELLRFNDAKCDPQGRLWGGTIAFADTPGTAKLYRVDPDRSVRVMRTGVTVSNGLAWSADGRTLYYIDSPTRCVQAFDFDGDTGAITRHRIALDLTSTPGFPDGCTIDTEGRLWIAHWDGARVTCWDPVKARLVDTLHVPVARPSSCTFGGPKLDTLFISSAADATTPAAAEGAPRGGYVFCADPGAQGRPADCCRIT